MRDHFNRIISMVLKEVIEQERIPAFKKALIGFIAFDSDLHFIRFTRKQSEANIFTLSDLDDLFIPFQDSILVGLEEFKTKILSFVDEIPKIFSKTEKAGSCLVKALEMAYTVMRRAGGRVIITTHSPEIANDVHFD